ncbi:hypothetical protein Gotur_017430 [Gossypium turneri]
MVKWSIELFDFVLEFLPRKTIKVQALADFIEESQPTLAEPELASIEMWMLFVVGLAGKSGSGASFMKLEL